ncbi:MAG: histidine--tRNA ligase [Burkholderiales bacterium]|nr:histidine--tRNA ligase [Burkholderiales bacterium]
MQKITAIKGMNDILPDVSDAWLWLESQLQSWLKSYGYSNIRTPIVENTNLFVRSIGEVTDIVEKEMYSFTDSLNGDSLSLRPEGTAGTLRAVIEHNLLYNATQKLWYIGPMFRHERPQKGRYRQFHQLGVEALGFTGSDIDAEIILMQHDLWQILDISNLELQINCLGNLDERAKHREALISYFEGHKEHLDADAQKRLYSNPLRILDTKNPALQDIVNNAPKLSDHLGEESMSHYANWKKQLDNLKINYVENHRLVRGLDYYNLSVFEWVSSDLGAQSTVCAGGRYDPLIKQLGGGDNYAIGFAIGLERLLLILEALNKLPRNTACDIFIANMGDDTAMYSFGIARELRASGYNVVQNLGNQSFKSQFKKADNLGAKFTMVIGENEVKNKQIMVKSMADGKQLSINHSELALSFPTRSGTKLEKEI